MRFDCEDCEDENTGTKSERHPIILQMSGNLFHETN